MSQENEQVLGAEEAKPLSVWTRICYGLGDTSCNIAWGAMGILTFFLYRLRGRFAGNRRLRYAFIPLF